MNPGLLRVVLGGQDVLGFSVKVGEIRTGHHFIDTELRLDRTTQLATLSQEDDCFDLSHDLMTKLFHAFGLSQPPPRTQWQFVHH